MNDWGLGALESFFHVFLEETGNELFDGLLAQEFFNVLLEGLEFVVSEFKELALL